MATAVGMLLALCVLAMTVGLIRSEAGRRVAGPDRGRGHVVGPPHPERHDRRRAGPAGRGAGCLARDLALVAGYRHDLSSLGRVPIADLALLLVGLPLMAWAAGWLLAGREPTGLSRSALE